MEERPGEALHYLVECEAIEILPVLFQEILIPPTFHRELQT